MMYAWNEKTPPRSHWVAAQYSVLEPVQIVKTCRHGCCVHGLFGSQTLPRYWRDATHEEVTSSKRQIDGARSISWP